MATHSLLLTVLLLLACGTLGHRYTDEAMVGRVEPVVIRSVSAVEKDVPVDAHHEFVPQGVPNPFCTTSMTYFDDVMLFGDTSDLGVLASPFGGCVSLLESREGLFYKVKNTAYEDLWISADTCSNMTNFDTTIFVFRDCDLTVCVTDNDNACGSYSRVQFKLPAGEEYVIFVTGARTPDLPLPGLADRGEFKLTIDFMEEPPYDYDPPDDPEPPMNARCRKAKEITKSKCITGFVSIFNFIPFLSDNPPCGHFNPSSATWGDFFEIVNNGYESVQVEANTCDYATNFDTVLALYKDCTLRQCLDFNDDAHIANCSLGASRLVFELGPGESVILLVSGFDDAFGRYKLTVLFGDIPTPPPPPPPLCNETNCVPMQGTCLGDVCNCHSGFVGEACNTTSNCTDPVIVQKTVLAAAHEIVGEVSDNVLHILVAAPITSVRFGHVISLGGTEACTYPFSPFWEKSLDNCTDVFTFAALLDTAIDLCNFELTDSNLYFETYKSILDIEFTEQIPDPLPIDEPRFGEIFLPIVIRFPTRVNDFVEINVLQDGGLYDAFISLASFDVFKGEAVFTMQFRSANPTPEIISAFFNSTVNLVTPSILDIGPTACTGEVCFQEVDFLLRTHTCSLNGIYELVVVPEGNNPDQLVVFEVILPEICGLLAIDVGLDSELASFSDPSRDDAEDTFERGTRAYFEVEVTAQAAISSTTPVTIAIVTNDQVLTYLMFDGVVTQTGLDFDLQTNQPSATVSQFDFILDGSRFLPGVHTVFAEHSVEFVAFNSRDAEADAGRQLLQVPPDVPLDPQRTTSDMTLTVGDGNGVTDNGGVPVAAIAAASVGAAVLAVAGCYLFYRLGSKKSSNDIEKP